MSQTRFGSFVEANANVVIGFALNWTMNVLLLPVLWNAANPKLSALYIGIVFTVISYARQLVLRRYFNGLKFGNTTEVAK